MKPKIIDLFCGAGGLSTGFEMAGFETLIGIEHIGKFGETFKANHPKAEVICDDIRKVTIKDIKKIIGDEHISVICGGPPCQGFSGAGRRDPKDPRNSLFMEFIRIVDGVKPDYFVMENVPGILTMHTADGEKVTDIIESEFDKIGYKMKFEKLVAADYGVPQKRRRVIFIGCHEKNARLPFPKKTHEEKKPVQALIKNGTMRPPPKQEVLFPKKYWIGCGTVLLDKDKVPKNYFHTPKMIEGFIRRKENNRKKGKGFGWQIINPEKPCYTISARYWKDGSDALVKYSDTEVRMLTEREVASIQSFPEDYEFCGSKKEKYMQVGNAVPCLMAKAIAESIKPHLAIEKDYLADLRMIWETKIRGKKTDEIPMPNDGALGHWVQSQFGLGLDNDPNADWRGLEIKTGRLKLTFGDWPPSRWILSKSAGRKDENTGFHPDEVKSQDEFVRMFGKPLTEESPRMKREKNPEKRKSLLGRPSWSGACPKIDSFNEEGGKLVVNNDGSVEAIYEYAHDQRTNKATLVPAVFQSSTIVLARWEKEKLKKHVDQKFGQKGWVKFVEKKGRYVKMELYLPITVETFLEWLRQGLVFFDTGMYEGNHRSYCHWRTSNSQMSAFAYEVFE